MQRTARFAAFLVAPACIVATLTASASAQTQRSLVALGGVEQLAPLVSGPLDELQPAPSPDGATVVYETKSLNERPVRSWLERVSVSTPTSRVRLTANDTDHSRGSPVWTSDGRTLYYRELEQHSHATMTPVIAGRSQWFTDSWISVVRLERASAGSAPLAPETVLDDDARAPWITPSGVLADGRILGSAMLRRQWHVVVLRGIVVTDLGEGSLPTLAPDGAHIAFIRAVDGVTQLFVMRADGSEATQVTHDDFEVAEPAFTSDGRSIVFVSRRSARADRTLASVWNLFAVSADGANLTELTDGDAVVSSPRCAPDGWVYFSSNAHGTFDVWRLRIAGAGVPVTPHTGGLRVRLTVTSARGIDAPTGAQVELTVSRRRSGRRIACYAHVVFGGHTLFGATLARGTFNCTAFPGSPPAVVGTDTEPTSEDGDAAFSIDTATGTFLLRDDAGGDFGAFRIEGRAEVL